MKSFQTLALVCALGAFGTVAAHPDHGATRVVKCKKAKTCTKDEIAGAAQKVIQDLCASGSLSASWKTNATPVDSQQSSRARQVVWTNSFRNTNEKDASKQLLYVAITGEGYLVGASHNKQDLGE